jgi:hypothetical protein
MARAGETAGNHANGSNAESSSSPAERTRSVLESMIPDSPLQARPDTLLHLLRSGYLRRLARFALIDDVPAPWGARGLADPVAGGLLEQPND